MVTDDNNGVASSSTLLAKLNTLQRKMTGKAAQDLLISLTKDHWFVEVRRNMINKMLLEEVCRCTCIHVYMYIYMYICTCIYVHVYIYMYTSTCIHLHVYMYMYICTCIYAFPLVLAWKVTLHASQIVSVYQFTGQNHSLNVHCICMHVHTIKY